MNHFVTRALRTTILVLFVAVLVLLCPSLARATNVTVDCGAASPPPGTFTSITAALATLDLSQPNKITVTGTCNESVGINNAENLTIEAPTGQTATIAAPSPTGNAVSISNSRNVILRRLLISGAGRGVFANGSQNISLLSCVLENNTIFGLFAINGSSVTISGATPLEFSSVRNNSQTGISFDGGVLNLGPNLIIENNSGQAMSTTGARVNFNTGGSGNIVRNNGAGLSLNTSVVTFTGENTIQNNGPFGMRVTGGELFVFERALPDGSFLGTTIEGHTEVGLFLNIRTECGLFGHHKIRNNGGAPTGIFPVAGIRVFANSVLQVGNGVEISNNAGPGILADLNSSVVFGFQAPAHAATISGNSEEGLRLTMLSAARFLHPTTIIPTGKHAVSCDSSSLVTGDLSGIAKVACKIEKAK